ncbi:unnamed protein product (macronuclear) [Paramecium tetraurelia]|uniref:Uncharacterized protein n=1 Tax=Paramecium tetraurelia TaxID=5888 RepID=A0D8Z0_PARTE|nr:uncharacterized protein GSPATT00014453001 [Paramecium tetraurelia]CAK79507.1 unnamed protein product [Paramecium tetraurelia]|eukprot:XP_001446904.1 hypothetical protein (macronuclear) [Paramecium tetraurelia strain d4-2]
MGFSCSKQKNDHVEIRIETKKQGYILQSQSTSKEAIDFIESTSLANTMRTKPIKSYLAEQIEKQQIQLDSCEILVDRIEAKSKLILRSYNHFTEKALKIKSIVLDFYRNEYVNYINSNLDTITNKGFIQKETIQLLIETTIILNCLMDKNFDDEVELWWGNDYFSDRIQLLALSCTDCEDNADNITFPIIKYIKALKNKIIYVMPVQSNQPKSISNSVAITNVHLTQFYKDLKMEFAKKVDDEDISP